MVINCKKTHLHKFWAQSEENFGFWYFSWFSDFTLETKLSQFRPYGVGKYLDGKYSQKKSCTQNLSTIVAQLWILVFHGIWILLLQIKVGFWVIKTFFFVLNLHDFEQPNGFWNQMSISRYRSHLDWHHSKSPFRWGIEYFSIVNI